MKKKPVKQTFENLHSIKDCRKKMKMKTYRFTLTSSYFCVKFTIRYVCPSNVVMALPQAKNVHVLLQFSSEPLHSHKPKFPQTLLHIVVEKNQKHGYNKLLYESLTWFKINVMIIK